MILEASIVFAVLAIVLIIQIIILRKMGKMSVWLEENTAKLEKLSIPTFSKKDRPPRDTKKNNKHVSGSTSKLKTPVSSVDKSLRDINLRLKNAERDQEKARRKLNGKHSAGANRKSGRDKVRRNNRSRNGSNKGTPQGIKTFAPKEDERTTSSTPTPENDKKVEKTTSAVTPSLVPETQNKSSEVAMDSDNKFTVKRRSLNAKEEGNKENLPLADKSEKEEEKKISFGRR